MLSRRLLGNHGRDFRQRQVQEPVGRAEGGGKNGYEWATGTNPTNPASITMLGIGNDNMDAVVSFTRNTNATDVAIELQRSLNLISNVWNGIATNTAGSWNPPGIVTESGSGNPVDVEITNTHTNHPAANYRLRVE